jgi:rubrerythrin
MVTERSSPGNYRQGLKFSIEDELDTVDFYLDISDRASDPPIRRAFKRAALDEQQHAGTFNFF